MSKQKIGRKIVKLAGKTIFWIPVILIGLIPILALTLQIPFIQKTIREQAVSYLEKELDTKVSIEVVDIKIFRHIVLEGLYLEDQSGDSLLYAGHAAIRIRSINPFSKDIRIGGIELYKTDVHVYRHAEDSTFNYSFILDAFSPASSDTSKTGMSVQIGLKEIDLQQVHFIYSDSLTRNAYDVYIHSLRSSFNKFSLQQEVLSVNHLEAIGCDIQLTKMFDNRVDTANTPAGYEVIHIAPGNWIIEAGNLTFDQCFFGYENENARVQEGLLDFNHLAMGDIAIDLEEITYVGDSLRGYMNNISFNDKSGFELTQLQNSFLFSPYEINLQGLLLKTPQTEIKDQLTFSYSTLNDFNRFFDDVMIEARFENVHIATDDLAFFSEALAPYHVQIGLDAPITGTISNLRADKALLRIDDASTLTANIRVRGLPNISETLFDIDMFPLTANLPALDNLLGGNALPTQITDLGAIQFSGRFTGFLYDFVVYGNMGSSIGKLQTDLRLNYDNETKTIGYSGTVVTEKFNAGRLAGNEDLLGEVSLIANVKGKSRPGSNEVVLSSQISQVYFNGYTYHNILASGEVTNAGYHGRLDIDDPNAKLHFNGSIDLNDSLADMNFQASIEETNLFALHLYPHPLTISAETVIDIQGADINAFLGDAVLTDISISNNKYDFDLKRLELASKMQNGIRTTSLESDKVKINVDGNYRIDQLSDQFIGMFNYYLYGTTFSNDSLQYQQFTYSIEATDLHELTAIFYPSVEQLDGLNISGSFNSGSLDVDSRLSAKNLVYEGTYFESLSAEIKNKNANLVYFLKSSEIGLSDKLALPVTSMEGKILRDSIDVNLKMGRDTDPERLNLFAGLQVSKSLVELHVLPSEIYVNDQKWDILANNSLTYNYKEFFAENFTLTNDQRLVSVTSSNKNGAGSSLQVKVEHFDIEDITRIAQYDESDITGELDANITISHPFDSLTMLGLINVNNLILDGQKIGNINITATTIYPNPRFNFNMNLRGENSMRAYGYYYNGEVDSLNMVAEITKIPFHVAEPFTKGLISQLQGDAFGTVKVNGPVNNLKTEGYVSMKNGSMLFDYLGLDLSFDYQKVELFPDHIYLTPNKLFDKFKNEGWVKGNIYHQNYEQFLFDSLTFTSENFVLMDATSKENPDFYGYTTGSASAIITGPLDELNITVHAVPKRNEAKNNVVYIPAFGSGNVSRHNFIRFVNRSDTSQIIEEVNNLSVVNVNTYVEVNPDVEAQILLSSEGTDVIKGRGSGDLYINVNTLGKVEISGLLKISDGSYDFSFEGLATKKFIVKEGGTILFDQDPYQAKLDLSAVYRLDRVPKLGLISDMSLSDQEIQEAKKAIPVDVYINIGGTLEAPNISFDIILPDDRGGGLSDFDQRLAEVKSDQNELNKQVFGLLMINKFLPKDVNAGAAIGASVNNSISDFITGQLSAYFSDWIAEIIPNAEIDIAYQKIGTESTDLSTSDQTQFEAGLTQRLFDDALTVKIGGTYNYETSNNDPNSSLAGDFEVEYKITPDGRIRIRAFRESDYDAVASKNDTRTGLGLFYTKDFDSLSELFQDRKK